LGKAGILGTAGICGKTGIWGTIGILGTAGTCNCGNFKLPLANSLRIDSIFDSNILTPAPLLNSDGSIENGDGSFMSSHGSGSPEGPPTGGYTIGGDGLFVGKSAGKQGAVDEGETAGATVTATSFATETPDKSCAGDDGEPDDDMAATALALIATTGETGAVDAG